MLRRSVILSLLFLSSSVQAAEAMEPLKVDPALLPQSKKAAKKAEKTQADNTQADTPKADETGVVGTAGEASAVSAPTADTATSEAPTRTPAAQSFPVSPPQAGASAPAASGGTKVTGRTPAAPVSRAGAPTPAAVAGADRTVDEVPPYRNVTIARNLPPLKVDPALMGTPPVARRKGPAPAAPGAAASAVAANAGARDDGTVLPPVVQEDDESQVLRGAITLSEYVERNPQSRATLIAGDELTGTTDEVMRAIGSAELRKPGTSLTADDIEYQPPTDELVATGNVRLVRGEDVVEGPSLRYKLGRGEGVFDKPRYTIRRNLQTGENLRTTTGRGEASIMEFLSDSRVRMENATYSTCGPDNPDWYAQADTLNLNFDSEVGDGRNGTIIFKGVPVLYSPWLDFSLNNRRKSGFLTPTFGVTNRTGFDLLLPYYWNIAPNMDATFAARILGTRGLMFSNEFRYLDHDYSGKLRLDYLPSDRIAERDRYAFSFQHQQRITRRLSTTVDINRVSDENYYTDLGTRLAITSVSYLPRTGNLTYSGDWWSVSAGATEYQALANRPSIYQQIPSVTLNAYRADLPAGMAFRLSGNFTEFRIDDLSRDEGRRTWMYPQLLLPMQTSFFSFTPKVGVHLTQYDLTRGTANAGQRDSLSRAVPIFSVDTSTVFEREADMFGQGMVQTLEPRFYYLYAPYRNQSDFPVFDTALADFNFAQIFSENVFSGQDRIADANQLTAAAVSRFIDPKDGAERARLAFGQRIYFADQDVTLPNGQRRTGSIASTLAAVSGELLPDTWVDAAVQYNTDLSQTERYSVAARWNPREAHVLNTAYRFRRSTTTGVSDIRDIDVSAQWPITNRWYGVARHNYSIAERRLVEGLAGVEYNGGCWIGRLVFQRIATNVSRTRTALFFQLELSDFSRIGSNPLDALKRSIPGYGQINQSAADPIFGGDY